MVYGQNNAFAAAACIFLHVVFDGHDEPVPANLRFSFETIGFQEDVRTTSNTCARTHP